MQVLSIRLLFIVSVCVLGGCFIAPTSGDYYTPSASGGEVLGYGDYSAPTTLSVKRGKNILIQISGFFLGGTVQTYVGNAQVEIRFYVPEAESLEIDLTKIRIYDAKMVQIANVSSISKMTRLGWNELKMETGDMFFTGYALPHKGNTVYIIEAKCDQPPPPIVYVDLPATKADGISYPPLAVKFTKTHGWWWQVYGP